MGSLINFDPEGRVIVPNHLHGGVCPKKSSSNLTDLRYLEMWEKVKFNFSEFLKECLFLGCVDGKRNRYYVYSNSQLFLLCTSLKEDGPSRMTIILKGEVSKMELFLEELYKKRDVIGLPMDIIETEIRDNPAYFKGEERMEYILANPDFNGRNRLYWLILGILYALSATGKFSTKTDIKRITFILDSKKSTITNKDILQGLHILGNFSNKVIFKKDELYFLTSFKKEFRGISYIYPKREIEHLDDMILSGNFDLEDIYTNKVRLNLPKILNEIRLDENNICNAAYREIMARNIKNGREVLEYTESRLKFALRILKVLKGEVLIEKDGRRSVYFRIKQC